MAQRKAWVSSSSRINLLKQRRNLGVGAINCFWRPELPLRHWAAIAGDHHLPGGAGFDGLV
jgi:hypothetical protein